MKDPSKYTAVHTLNFELKHRQNFSKVDDEKKEILLKIKKDGYIVIPNFLDKSFCDSCIKDSEWMFENKKEFIQDIFDMRIFGAEELSENIKKFADDKLINEIAEAYNAVPTTMGFTLTNKIEAKDQEFGSGGSWHRDSYFRQFKSILYLNDVNENNGPFQIVTKSNKSNQIKKDTKIGNLEQMQSRFDNNEIEKIIENEPERVHTLTGKAGTLILVDTSTIHRGKPLKNGIRYALTNYFFEKTQINSHLVEHFSPLVSPEKVLKMGNTEK